MELKRYLVHQQGQYYDNLKRDLFKQSAMWNSLIRKISMSTQSLAINVAIKHKNFSTQLNLLEQSLEDVDEQLLSKITMICIDVNVKKYHLKESEMHQCYIVPPK